MIAPEIPRSELIAIIELLTALVTSGLEPAAVMKQAAEHAAAITHASGAVVELVDGSEMVYSAVWGTASSFRDLRIQRQGSLSGLCVHQAAPLHCEDAETDPRVDRAICERVGIRSMICVPLFHKGRAVGVLKVLSRRKNAFHDTHVEALAMVASVIAASLANAGRYADANFERYHDPLTRLRNRRAYQEELALEVARHRRYHRPLTLVLLDLNNFKAVNDTHGHPAGDSILRGTADALRRSTRLPDRCYRIGGDEFAILLPETTLEQAESVLRHVLPEIERLGMGISASAGLAEPGKSMRPPDLHAAADQALYAEKEAFHARSSLRRA
jgi:diguanylate cyclase (GGDEF)-like protein